MKENIQSQYDELQKELKREFEAKNEILRACFLELSPYEYLDLVFPEKTELTVVFGSTKDNQGNVIHYGTVKRISRDDIWDIAGQWNAYMPYCDFKKNYYHSKTLEAVRAFVNDCDKVTSTGLTRVLKYLWDLLPAKPTHIVNSGQGFHFVYVLDRPVQVKGLRWTINALNKDIQDKFSQLLKVDKHPVVHPYRFPGFQTKIDTKATVFQVRKAYRLEELMKHFRPTRNKAEGKGRAKNQETIYMPNGKRGFFVYVLRRLFINPPIPGRRHNSFFALGIISYKCRREVPYQEALEAIPMVYEVIMERNLHTGFTLDEAYKAFHKGYKQQYVRATWKYLTELLGWEYRPNKRNGRKRQQHLKLARQIKELYARSRWEELEEHIKHLLEQGYPKRKIAEMVGISHDTLYRRFSHLWLEGANPGS